jgi:hypothetical protein
LRECFERVVASDARKPRDRPPTPRDHDAGASLDTVEMLAESIVKFSYPNLVRTLM